MFHLINRLSKCFVPSRRRRIRSRNASSFRRSMRCEGLEDRRVMASIVWVNEGVQDNFDDVFGAQADVARGVVHAVIDSWENVIDDFHNNNGNTYNLYLRMATEQDVEDYGFGGGSIYNRGGQAPPSAISAVNGIPYQGLVLLGRGEDGLGTGYFIDPTHNDHLEFQGEILNAFSAEASDPAAAGRSDFYSLVQAEVTHALGLTSASGTRYRELIDAGPAGVNGVSLIDTGVTDSSYFGINANLWAFHGPSINYLMTDIDGNSKGLPVHTALPNNLNVVVSNNIPLRGNFNLGNPTYYLGTRSLVPNSVALMLQDTYGYTLASGGPERQATFYALQNAAGDAWVRGSDSTTGDSVIVTGAPAYVQVSVNPGEDVPGTDPFTPGTYFSTHFSKAILDDLNMSLWSGNDSLLVNGSYAGLGAIVVEGGDGNDTLDASLATGHAFDLRGGSGNDTLRGGSLGDTLTGGTGNDRLDGNGGNDNMDGDAGNDEVYGGEGNDTVRGSDGNDRLYGENGNDLILAGLGNDRAYGGNGNDEMIGDTGDDRLEGGNGADVITGNRGRDVIIGGIELASSITIAYDGADRLSGNEDDDIIIGDNSYLLIPSIQGGGNDNIFGGAGNDMLWGGLGDDTMNGEVGNDQLNGGLGNDQMFGGIGEDLMRGMQGNDVMNGDEGNDILLGGAGADQLTGGLGRDLLIGGTEADVMSGGNGDDLLISGTTTHEGNDTALRSIMMEWSSLHSYTDRVRNLRNQAHGQFDQRLNGNVFLRLGVEVQNDAAGGNTVNGQGERDWLFAGLADLGDLAANESIN